MTFPIDLEGTDNQYVGRHLLMVGYVRIAIASTAVVDPRRYLVVVFIIVSKNAFFGSFERSQSCLSGARAFCDRVKS